MTVGRRTVATVVIPLVTLALVAPMQSVKPPPPAPAGIRKVLGAVWLPGSALALSGVGFSAIMTFASLLYASRNWSPAWLAFTALSVAFIFGRGVLGHLPDKLGGVRVALACIVVEAIGQALIWFAPNAMVTLVGVTVTGRGYSLVYPGLGSTVSRDCGFYSLSQGFYSFDTKNVLQRFAGYADKGKPYAKDKN